MSITNYSLKLRARFALIYRIAGNIGGFLNLAVRQFSENLPIFPAIWYMRANLALS